jgi:hypothetical protein
MTARQNGRAGGSRGGVLKVDRAQVMAYRVAALQLDRRVRRRPADLAVADLGVQEYTPGSTRVALAARTSAALDDDRLLMVWAARGAPHLHRRSELPALARALWPVNDADASTRIASPQISEGAKLGIAAFTATAQAMQAVVTGSMPRGEVSTQVSARVPTSVTYDCRTCKARHISGALWQHAGLAGGVFVESRGSGATLAPIDGWPGVPKQAEGTGELITTYLRLLGPATPNEAASYLGTRAKNIRAVWPDGLAEVEVDGRTTWLPETSLDALRAAAPAEGVRLLPAMDALLQARDRDVLVPERAQQKQVWRVLGNPGVLLLDGEIGATWRAKLSGRRLELTVTPFGRLGVKGRAALDDEAAVVAAARGAAEARVTVG